MELDGETGGLIPHNCPKSEYNLKKANQGSVGTVTLTQPKTVKSEITTVHKGTSNIYRHAGFTEFCTDFVEARETAKGILHTYLHDLDEMQGRIVIGQLLNIWFNPNFMTKQYVSEFNPTEIGKSQMNSAGDGGGFCMDISSDVPTVNGLNPKNTITTNIKQMIRDNPTFFSTKQTNNSKLKMYYKLVFGIDISLFQKHSAEGVLRMFRHILPKDLKHSDEEQFWHDKFAPSKFGRGTIEGGLLLD